MRDLNQVWTLHVMNNVQIVNPNIDASEKQVLLRNNFITNEAWLALILKDEMNKLNQHEFKPSDLNSLNFIPRLTKKEVKKQDRDNEEKQD